MKLFVSCGDVNGIGLETFFKSIQSMDILDHEMILCIHPKTLEESGLAGPLIIYLFAFLLPWDLLA